MLSPWLVKGFIYWKKYSVCAPAAKLYRPRNPEALPFYKLVRDHFDEFERVYDERFQPKYGYWRPAIRSAMDKFLKCGDVREGFARVRCPDCCKEFFVAFSCKQRCCCPSCDQKRALLLGMRLTEEVFAPVGHRQWVLTMPKRLRIFFRNDRRLLGKLCRLAYETIRDGLCQACRNQEGEPGFVGAVQTFGDLINWNSHVHAIVSEGLFKRDGFFIRVVKVDMERCTAAWREPVFDLLLREEKIDENVVQSMRAWPHSGFSIDNSVQITADDTEGMQLKKKQAAAEGKQDIGPEDGNGFLKKRRMSWAALIKKVYEVDPLSCPACGGAMQIISFIDKCQPEVVEKILWHCGLWKTAESPPPVKSRVAEPEPYYDYGYFDRVCI